MEKRILVTGGTGFIGSHACVALLEAGYAVVILDSLCNSDASVVGRIGRICAREPDFVKGDVRDEGLLGRLFATHRFNGVLHFAGLKAVGESVTKPLAYFDNNVGGTLSLLKAMQSAAVRTIVFSSSATVYGDPASVPISEDFPRSPANPYGASKIMVEDILDALHRSEPGWRIARLRYFNPVGAHASGLIGEDPRQTPNNLMPLIVQAAAGVRPELQVYGDDYDTRDGTGVRDYIHVVDLAHGHVAALDYLQRAPGMLTVNLGTGRGLSVLEMIAAFEAANAVSVPYRVTGRRPGDVASCWADAGLAGRLLNWRARLTLEDMCRDAWRWQLRNAAAGTAQ